MLLRGTIQADSPGAANMDLGLDSTTVIITAGGAGIGLAIAKAFVAEGARVEICDIDTAALDTVRQSLPNVGVTCCDVTDRTAVGAFIDDAVKRLGGLDVLVNNAGIAGPTAPVEDIAPADWDRCIDVCLTGQYNCIRCAVPYLRGSDNASIVNLSSVAGRLGFAMRSPYAAAKWAVVGLSKSLAIELGPDGIRVNAILPGIVAGERQRQVMEAKAQAKNATFDAIEAEAFSYTSIKDYVTAEQLADHILYITSTRGRTVSGQAISICGDVGMLA